MRLYHRTVRASDKRIIFHAIILIGYFREGRVQKLQSVFVCVTVLPCAVVTCLTRVNR